MAGSTITYPANGASNWENFPDIVQKIQAGHFNFSFDEMDTGQLCDILAGSNGDLNGTICTFASAETPTGFSGLSTDEFVYLYLSESAGSVTATWSATAPNWSAAKRGWYNSNDRAILEAYKDADGNCSQKRLMDREYYFEEEGPTVEVAESVSAGEALGIDTEGKVYKCIATELSTANIGAFSGGFYGGYYESMIKTGANSFAILGMNASYNLYIIFCQVSSGTISATTAWTQVNTNQCQVGTLPSMCHVGNGDVVVSWVRSSDNDIKYAVVYDNSGTVTFRATETNLVTGAFTHSSVCTIDESNGRFVLVARSTGNIAAGVYNWNGSSLSTDVAYGTVVNDDSTRSENYPQVVCYDTNKAVVGCLFQSGGDNNYMLYTLVFTSPSTLTVDPTYTVNTWQRGLFAYGSSTWVRMMQPFLIRENLVGMPYVKQSNDGSGYHPVETVLLKVIIKNDKIAGYTEHPITSTEYFQGVGVNAVLNGDVLALGSVFKGDKGDAALVFYDMETLEVIAGTVHAISNGVNDWINSLGIVEVDTAICTGWEVTLFDDDADIFAVRLPKYLGVAKTAAAANGETKALQRGHLRALTGLTRGSHYSVDYDDAGIKAGKSGVVVGQAISAKEIILRGV